MTTRADVGRAARVRRAMVELVAERGIHGTSMSQVAEHAGVATGTAYVHYESKEEVLIASFVEIKRRLGHAGVAGVDLEQQPRVVFEQVWRRIHSHLENDPAAAQFLAQFEVSPLRDRAHEALLDDDPLSIVANGLADHLVDLPVEVLYDLALAPAVRLAASQSQLRPDQVDLLVESCWRAVSRK